MEKDFQDIIDALEGMSVPDVKTLVEVRLIKEQIKTMAILNDTLNRIANSLDSIETSIYKR